MKKLFLVPIIMLLTLSSCSTYQYVYEYDTDPIYEETYVNNDPVILTDNSYYVIVYRMDTRPWQRPWDSMWYYDSPMCGYNYHYTNWGYNYNSCSYWSPFMPGYNPYWNPYNNPYSWNGFGGYWNNPYRPPYNWMAHSGNNRPWYKSTTNMNNKPALVRNSVKEAPVRELKTNTIDRSIIDTRQNTQQYNRNQSTQERSIQSNYYQRPTTPTYNRSQNYQRTPSKPITPTYNRNQNYQRPITPPTNRVLSNPVNVKTPMQRTNDVIRKK